MNAQIKDSRVEWTRKGQGAGQKEGRRRRLVLVGARFRRDWLEQSVETSEIHFDGDLGQVLNDLLSIGRNATDRSGMSLPVSRLRASLFAQLPGIISVDRDLGVVRRDGPRFPALTLNRLEAGEKPLPQTVGECIRRWYQDALSGWAERHSSPEVAERVLKASVASNIRVVPATRSLIINSAGRSRPDYALIIRQFADSLIGEELFEGLGPCELVTDGIIRDPGRGNSIELMTQPTPSADGQESFSMVARFAAVSMPYSEDVHLRVSASKRTWASRLPGPKRNAPYGIRGYVMAPERPFYTVSLARSVEHGWQFGDDYAEWLQIAAGRLPEALSVAVAQRRPDASGWWAGMPLLPVLFDSVPQRTVFEGDELDLRDQVIQRMQHALHADVPFRALQLPRGRSGGGVAMLRLSDLGLSDSKLIDLGVAGQALEELDADSSDEVDEESKVGDSEEKTRASLDRHREQNIRALKIIHGDKRPVLWLFCQSVQEREVIEKSVEQLFGDAVELRAEQLPVGTHGLRTNLPGAQSKQRERFDLRVKAWKDAAEAVHKGPEPRHVLICAADRDNGRAEDPVNYYAGLHAMCSIADANVHHVLPIAAGDPIKSTQHFVHRLQSALLDVFFAHSGVIFGTKQFLSELLGSNTPAYVYGIQAARSQARTFTGEVGVSFLLFTRLHVSQGTTEIKVVYRSKRKTGTTDWMALNKGLRWLGSQRELESDESWLRDAGPRQIRDFLGDLQSTDPKAVVLVDWSTVQSVWRGLSDEDLTRDCIARIDGKDIAAACPGISLVRLRKGEHSISLRSLSTSWFQRSGARKEFAGPEATGQLYTETYTTTTKAIVAVEPPKDVVPKVSSPRHYIQSMGYRSTVQILRGQSCYKPTKRMKKSRGSERTFELVDIQPGHQDAALPAPLEVTVMTCPATLNADALAIAVLGLRLGYVHYNDWTALPAPLFFKRKVDDYVVRYRSPGTSDAEGDDEENSSEPASPPTGDSEVPDASDPPPASSAFLNQTVQEVLPPAAADPPDAKTTNNNREEISEESDEQRITESTLTHVSEAELAEIAAADDAPDEKIVEVVQRLGRDDLALCGPDVNFKRRRIYENMLRGQIRIHVQTPEFVTPIGIFGDEPPTEREAVRRFWRDTVEMGWVRHNEQMPALTKLPQWMYRRLQIPQGGYSMYSDRLFPRRFLFNPINQGWRRYLEERAANAGPEDSESRELTEGSIRLDLLMQWATTRGDDDLIAWVVFGCAHFPFPKGTLDEVLPYLKPPVGQKTYEALYYFIDCARASRLLVAGNAQKRSLTITFPHRSHRRSNRSEAQRVNTTEPINCAQLAEIPESAAVVSSRYEQQAPSTLVDSATTGAPSAGLEHVSTDQSPPSITLPVPGSDDFESTLAEIQVQLEQLETSHRGLLQSRQLAQLESERIAAADRERAEKQARWLDLQNQASQLLERMRLELPDMQSLRAQVTTDIPEPLDSVERKLSEFRSQIENAKRAQTECETTDTRATPPAGVTPREAGRHRILWQDALRNAHDVFEKALLSLTSHIHESPLFVAEEVEPADGVDLATREGSHLPPTGHRTEKSVLPPEQVEAAAKTAIPPTPPETLDPAAGDPSPSGDMQTSGKEANDVGAPSLDEAEELIDSAAQPELEVEAEFSLEPLASRERSVVLSALVSAKAFAAASTYLQAISLDRTTEGLGDHVTVVAAAIESIRRLRTEGSTQRAATAQLRSWLEDRGTIDLRGCDPVAGALGVLAAGIYEMLFPSDDTSARWTYINFLQHRFGEHPGLEGLIKRIEGLEGIFFGQEMLAAASIGARHAAHHQVTRMRERAANWHADESLYRKWTIKDYRQLHEALFKNESLPIGKCLGMIARGEDEGLVEAFRDASKRMIRPRDLIESIGRRIGRRHPFDGVGREYVTNNIKRTHGFIEEYLEAVRRANGLQQNPAVHAQGALQGLYSDLVSAAAVAGELQLKDPMDQMYRDIAIVVLTELKRIFDCGEPSPATPESDQMLLLRLPLGTDGRPSLLSLPDASGFIAPPVVDPLSAIEEIESLENRFVDSHGAYADANWLRKQLEQACDDHLAQNRLLPARLIDQRLGRPDQRNGETIKAQGFLLAKLHHERQRVTHAMALGALGQAEASRMLRIIEDLLQIKTIGDPNFAPATTPDFPHAFHTLARLVVEPLDTHLAKSRDQFLLELDVYLEEHKDQPTLSVDLERIRALAKDHNASSMRAARDMFSLLKEGHLPKKVIAASRTAADDYIEFIQQLRGDLRGNRPLVELLIRNLREPASESDPFWLSCLDQESRLEAIVFLESWEQACEAKTPQECERPLNDFLRGLRPFEPTLHMDTNGSHAHRIGFFLEDRPLSGLDRSIRNLFIPPRLGSERDFVEGIVMRRTAPDTAVSQAIEERSQTIPTLLLSRSNWTLEQRAAISRQHPVLLVDDNLVAYVALHRDQRLQKLLQVALLTFCDNPYDDYGKPVPPEMFFGRQPELRRLRAVKMGAVLYGGRRLGKSSLLDELQRDGESSADEVVVVLTLDRADRAFSDDHSLLAWNAVYRRLIHAQVLSKPQKEPVTSTAITRWIEDEILAGRCKAKRIYLLIDEADEIMGRDLHKDAPFVSSLWRLCESVREKCSIRFVIAGLHNLARMANEVNSPLGKFESIALKPFWSSEDIQRGIELIKTPLESLGFYFGEGSEDLPLRIMAVCNFYPAFIQLYCKRLIEILYVRRDRSRPPTFIKEEDLVKVEMDRDFLAEIRRKFKLNLDLDKRYAAIALVLADQYYADGAKSLTAAEIRNLCDLFAARHFETTGPGAYASLLDEMETLTILEREGAKYALRTPNIAMMLGDRDSVGQQFDLLSSEVPVQSRSRGELRTSMTSLSKGQDKQVFPMPSAWVRHVLTNRELSFSGQSEFDRELLVFVGNELSGLTHLAKLRGEWQLGDTVTCQFGVYQSPNAARSILLRSARALASRTVASRRLHCVSSGYWRPTEIAEYARLASTMGAASASSDADNASITRLALIANPAQAYEIARMITGEQDDKARWRVIPIPPWGDDALYFRLEELEKPDISSSEEARKSLLAASCGFGAELERLLGGRLRLDDAMRAPSGAEKHLAPDLESFYGKIGIPPGVESTELRRVEELLAALDGEKRDPNQTDDFRKESGVSSELFLFVQWMGLLQEVAGGTWQIPSLYKRLLT